MVDPLTFPYLEFFKTFCKTVCVKSVHNLAYELWINKYVLSKTFERFCDYKYNSVRSQSPTLVSVHV